MTYTIYASAVDEIRKMLDRATRKAVRYGTAFSYTVGQERPMTVYVYDEGHIVGKRPKEYTVAAVDVEINGDGLIRKDGWTVCARVEHGNAGNVVTPFGEESAPDDWFHAPARCEHCRTNRFRNVTFMCGNANGEIKQVGKTCLKDYTGIDPAAALMWAEVRDVIDVRIVRDCDREEWERGSHATMYNVGRVIGLAADEIAAHGYRKSGERDSTKGAVIAALNYGDHPSDAGSATAVKVVEWLKGLADGQKETAWLEEKREKAIKNALANGWTREEIESGKEKVFYENEDGETCYMEVPFDVRDFLPKAEYPENNPYRVESMERSCISLAAQGYAKSAHVGLLAYMPLAYERYMDRVSRAEKRVADREAEAAASGYVGAIKERITITAVTAKLITSWEGDFGMTYLYRFVDGSGNVFIWYASKKISVHDGMTIKGTVKNHSEYDGIKQTVLTRCTA